VEAAEEQESRMVVLPDATEFETKTANDADGTEFTYYVGIADGETVGYVFVTQASGYGGKVKIMTGMDANGVITGVATLDVSNETPGLGANASKESFRDQFKETDANNGQLAVQKDGGTVEALTGATITSRAVTTSVNLAIDQYQIVKEAA
jgi:electron transport complex protein RnfG